MTHEDDKALAIPATQSPVDEFNEAFRYHLGDLKVLEPVDAETLESLATIASLRGRDDIAAKLRVDIAK